MRVPSQAINRMRNIEAGAIYGPASQLVRLEWTTITGGTYNKSKDAIIGGTPTVNVLDNQAAIWGPVQRDQREKERIVEQVMSIAQEGYWFFDNSLNLTGKDDLVILQRVMDLLFSGAGTTAAAVWTPDTAPAWTVSQWVGYWLVFPTSRFKILSNDALSVTVDLKGGTLPVGSNAGEILNFIKWKPHKDDKSNPGGSMSALGQEMVFQSIRCSNLGIVGV